MIRRRNGLFSTSAAGRDLYQQPYAQAGGNPPLITGEIDLRAELDEFFFGYRSGVRHGYLCLIRRLERDSAGKPVECSCMNELAREADPDCSYCFGEGYISTEGWAWTYNTYIGADGGLSNRIQYVPPGNVRVDNKIFYFRYDANINYGDKIVEVKLDEEGNVVIPYIRQAIYTPNTIDTRRSDNSRIEFITVYCKEGDALRLDRP